ncbi:MAG: ATP-binding protein [Solirubrobacteraceae bacterium]
MSDRVSPTAAPATRDWPLVGRDAELQQIAAARASPSCPGVVISGAVGVGRSRLARETVADADRAGELTYWAQGTRSSATIPLGALPRSSLTIARESLFLVASPHRLRRSAACP